MRYNGSVLLNEDQGGKDSPPTLTLPVGRTSLSLQPPLA